MDRRDRLEELRRLLDRHVEDLGDGLALVVHLERLAVVPGAVADLARHVHVRQEVHLDLDGAVTRTRLAAAALDVEREPARLISAHLGLGGRGEQRPDLVEDAGVGRRVGPRRATDRRLVDAHQLVELVEPVDAGVPTRYLARAVELVGQHRRQDVVDEGRLARTRDARHRGEHAERERHVDLAQVVLPCADDRQLALAVDGPADSGHLDAFPAGKVSARDGFGVGQQVLVAAAVHDAAAVLTRRRADVDHPVGMGDGVEVVFDDDQRVAEVAQPDQGVDQSPVVALMQADGRLVEHVQHADQAGPDLRGEPNALRLTAGQRAGGTGQRQVVEADVEQEAQPGLHLLEHLSRDRRARASRG